MKYLILLILLIQINQVSAQNKLDTLIVIEKAKLLTVSKYGTFSSTEMNVRDILSQKATVLKPRLKEYIIIKIQFDQQYMKGDVKGVLFGSCDYLIAFNVINYVFYRIGGFDVDETDEFLDNLTAEDYQILIEEIPITDTLSPIKLWCYLDNQGRKVKKRKICHCKCSEELGKTFAVY